MQCGHTVALEDLLPNIQKYQIPACLKCSKKRKKSNPNQMEKGKKNKNSVYKPNIVLYGEALPKEVAASIEADREKVDLILVIGSSLKVAPMNEMLNFFPRNIPRVLINKTKLDSKFQKLFDLQILGCSDDIVDYLCCQLNWKLMGLDSSIASESQIVKLASPACYVISSKLSTNEKVEEEEEETERSQELVVFTCDGCGSQIVGDVWQCCSCFDYALCNQCYDLGFHKHHQFSKTTQ